jgi:5,5'-dehydrodivanillate O-demethylase
VGFDAFPYGVIKRRYYKGQTKEDDEWKIGHPVVFPNILSVGNGDETSRYYAFQIRVPADDSHTLHLWYTCYAREDAEPQEVIPFYQVPVPGVDATGEPDWSLLDNNSGEDMIAWITQGAIADRTQEALGLSDKGIILYRRQLKEQMEKVQAGQDPMNVFRDPARNVLIKLRLEDAKLNKNSFRGGPTRQGGATKYSPILNSEK